MPAPVAEPASSFRLSLWDLEGSTRNGMGTYPARRASIVVWVVPSIHRRVPEVTRKITSVATLQNLTIFKAVVSLLVTQTRSLFTRHVFAPRVVNYLASASGRKCQRPLGTWCGILSKSTTRLVSMQIMARACGRAHITSRKSYMTPAKTTPPPPKKALHQSLKRIIRNS